MSKDTVRVHGAMGRLACSGLLAAAFSFAAVTDNAWAYNDGQVIRGDVTFTQNGNTLIITASDGSIIEYLNFNILPNETVRFIQPGDWARVLNRITGGEPSLIQGRLLANGQVYLVNPAGVIFGKDSIVNVGGLYAAAGQISNSDFINGVDRFTNLEGAIVNEGQIRAGNLHLLGQHVANHGLLKSDEGVITMVAGNEVLLKRIGERITVRVDGDWLTDGGPRHGSSNPSLNATPGVENTGTVVANGGQVFLGAGDMYSLAVKNSGVVKAAGGEIRVAAKDGAVHNTGRLLAHVSDGTAGTITVQGPSVVNSGDMFAYATSGQGGHIEVTSQHHTYLLNGSHLSVAGGTGFANGGSVLVHSYEGLTVFSNGAQIDARGGRSGGNGGFVEVSGELLVFNGRVRLDGFGPAGRNGTLLIDPRDITIADNGTDDGFVNDGTIDFNEPDQVTDLTISDEALEAIVGDILLQATRDIFVNHQVDLVNGNNVQLEAWRDIRFNAAINGANNLVVLADLDGNAVGLVQLNVPVQVAGNAMFDGASIRLNGNSVKANGNIEFAAPVLLLGNNTVTAGTVLFGSTVNGARNLIVNGDTTFADRVGNTTKLNILRVTGDAAINGGFVGTTLDQLYIGDVTINQDTILQGTSIAFNGTVDGTNVGQDSLSMQGSGIFRGAVGGNVQLESLKVFGKARIDGGLVNTSNLQSYQDNVTFGNDTVMNGTLILFSGPVDALVAGGQGLTINGDATFNGQVGGLRALKDLTVFGNTTIGGGLIRAENDIYLGGGIASGGLGAVVLTADALIESLSGNVTIDGTLDGAFNGTLRAADMLRIQGNVGGNDALASVDLGGNLIVLGGSLVRTLGDIKLNAAGRADIPVAATIVGNGDLTFESANGNFTMGQHEKLTVLGNLVVDAANGTATLSDITTLNDMTINAAQIEILLREGGMVLLSDGSFVEDGGVDFVAGGSIDFSSTPTLIGTGRGPIFASGSGNADVSGTLGAFDRITIDPITLDDLILFAGKGESIVLDLAVSVPDDNGGGGGNGGGGNGGGGSGGGGSDGGGTDDNLPDGLAEAIGEDELLAIGDRVFTDPIARDDLSLMGIVLRDINRERDITSGLRVINDLPAGTEATGVVVVSAQRLNGRAIARALNAFRALGLNTDDAAASDAVRQSIATAWTRYSSETGATDSAGFVAWAEAQTDDAAAQAVTNLATLWRNMQVSGLNQAELEVVASNVLAAVLPGSVNRDALATNG